jgi:hypothetical protein
MKSSLWNAGSLIVKLLSILTGMAFLAALIVDRYQEQGAVPHCSASIHFGILFGHVRLFPIRLSHFVHRLRHFGRISFEAD